MKKLIRKSISLLSTFTLVCVLVINYSCNKQSIVKRDSAKKLKAEDFAFIGDEHNKGLTSVFNALNAKIKNEHGIRIAGANFRTEFYQMIYDEAEMATVDYVTQYADNYDDPTSNIAFSIISNVFDGAPLVAPTGEIYSQYFEDSLSLNEKSYLNNLNIIMSDGDYDLSSLISRIVSLENNVYSQSLTEEEQFTIYSATSVAKGTLQYWHDSYDSWSSLLASNNTSNMRTNGFSWKEVGRSDVAGAAWGASACGVARFFGPIGWKAWAIGVIGSAVGGSAYNAVDQLLR